MKEEDADIVIEKKPSGLNRWLITGLLILVAFLLGLVPMWLKAREAAKETEATQKTLRKAEIRNLLTTAIVEAKSGEYEPARQAMSEFFTNLNAEIERADEGTLTAEQRAKLKPVFDNRDNIITMLAQRDPASVERLTDIYVLYKQALPAAQNTSPAR